MRNFKKNSLHLAWTSQLGQDKWVASILGGERYFVDIGAADGVRMSNTYVLEKCFGWRGLCVEPSGDFQMLRQVRNCLVDNSCVADSSNSTVDFQIDSQDRIFSGIADSVGLHVGRSGNIVRKQTTALTQLLDRYECPHVIDYLSLDTEGSEYLILKNMDFKRYCFRLITVEHNFEEPKRTHLFELLSSRGYSRVLTVSHDDWYVLPRYLSSCQLLKVRARQLASYVPPRWRPKIRRLAASIGFH